MAFQYWQQRENSRPAKTRYVALTDAYHGDTLGSVSVGGVERFHAMFRPLLFDCLRVPAPVTYRAQTAVPRERLAAHYLEPVERLLAERHAEIAALVVEPLVQAAAGMLVHPPGYLRGLRELTRRYDVLLIADEVAVGFGRTGRMFACEQEEVSPDFLCLGKGITGGYLGSMAATLATDEVAGKPFSRAERRGAAILSWPHLQRQPAGGRRGPGLARYLRRRAGAGPPAGEDRPACCEHLDRIGQHHEHVGDVRGNAG